MNPIPARLPVPILGIFGLSLACALAYARGLDVVDQYFLVIGLIIWTAMLLGVPASMRGTAPKRISPTSLLMAFMIAWLFVGVGFSAIPAISQEVALSLGMLPLTYFLVRWTQEKLGGWDDLLILFHGAGAIVAAFAILEFCFIRTRTMSLFIDFNGCAALLNLSLFSQYGRLLVSGRSRASGWPSASEIFLMALLTAALATTQSLGALLTFVLALTTLLVIRTPQDRTAWTVTLLYPTLLIAAYLVVYALKNEDNLDPMQKLANVQSALSVTSRVLMWKSAWSMFLDHPLVGIGPGMFKFFYAAYRDPREATSGGNYAHNDYIETLAEGGPLLLACLLGLLGITLLRILGLWRQRNQGSSPDIDLRAGLLVAMLAVQLHAFINFIFYLMPLGIGMGLFFAKITEPTPVSVKVDVNLNDQRAAPARLRLWITLLLLLFAISTATLGARGAFNTLVWGHCGLQGCVVKSNPAFLRKLANYLEATQPTYLPAHLYLAERYETPATAFGSEREQLQRRALLEAMDTIRTVSRAGFAYADVGRLLEESPNLAQSVPEGQPRDPEFYLRKAIELNPVDMGSRTRLADRMERNGQDAQAYDLLFVDGMRWWQSPMQDPDSRSNLLKHAIPLALKLGHCQEAEAMAAGLIQSEPKNDLAGRVVAKVPADATLAPGCGLDSATGTPPGEP